jgi:NAD(P)H-hydrate repair Nnr-like enzyme with NAD(P)H-hydrate epimerase domain
MIAYIQRGSALLAVNACMWVAACNAARSATSEASPHADYVPVADIQPLVFDMCCAGGDSGIGRAVAVHFAREGADVAIVYLDEHKDADETAALVEKEGRKCLKFAGDVGKPEVRASCYPAVTCCGSNMILFGDVVPVWSSA